MLQQTINFFYRIPRSQVKRINRFGGLPAYLAMLRERKEMIRAAFELPAIHSFKDGLPVYFLTGERYLYQTLFCIRSLSLASREKFRFILVDDGTFNQKLITIAKRLLPGAEIITAEMIAENLARVLPQQHFPVLNKKRGVYPHIRKLTDIHTIAGNRWKLVLDSDMLFWHNPSELIDWLKSADKQPLTLIDCVQSYGYSIALMEKLCGKQISKLLNVGAVGLESEAIDWEKLERWIQVLEDQEGTSYYLEQALTAMIIGGKDQIALGLPDYVVGPDDLEGHNRQAKLHHYVDLSKKRYFIDLWKKITTL
jgi:hypothetical protein